MEQKVEHQTSIHVKQQQKIRCPFVAAAIRPIILAPNNNSHHYSYYFALVIHGSLHQSIHICFLYQVHSLDPVAMQTEADSTNIKQCGTLRFQKVVSATTQYLYYLWKLALDAMPEDEHIVACSSTDQGFFRTVPKTNCGGALASTTGLLETPVQAPYTRTWLRANPNCTSNMGPWPETTESRTGGSQWKARLLHCVAISEPPT